MKTIVKKNELRMKGNKKKFENFTIETQLPFFKQNIRQYHHLFTRIFCVCVCVMYLQTSHHHKNIDISIVVVSFDTCDSISFFYPSFIFSVLNVECMKFSVSMLIMYFCVCIYCHLSSRFDFINVCSC